MLFTCLIPTFQIKEEDESKTSSRNSIDKAVTTITITNGDSDIRNSSTNIAVIEESSSSGKHGGGGGSSISDSLNNNEDEAVGSGAGVLKEKVTRK